MTADVTFKVLPVAIIQSFKGLACRSTCSLEFLTMIFFVELRGSSLGRSDGVQVRGLRKDGRSVLFIVKDVIDTKKGMP